MKILYVTIIKKDILLMGKLIIWIYFIYLMMTICFNK